MGVQIPYRRELEFSYGECGRVGPRIRRVIAENPSPFTLYGTGTYILGNGEVAMRLPMRMAPMVRASWRKGCLWKRVATWTFSRII